MAFAVTKVMTFGSAETRQPVNERFEQTLVIEFTAAAADVALDILNASGTFWTAAGGTALGAQGKVIVASLVSKLAYITVLACPEIENVKNSQSVGAVATTQYKKNILPTTAAGYVLFAGEGVTSGKIILKGLLKKGEMPDQYNLLD